MTDDAQTPPTTKQNFIRLGISAFKEHELREIVATFCKLPGIAPQSDGAAAKAPDLETIQTLLDLLNPLHGELDRQTYDAKVAMDFDTPSDYEHDVVVSAQMERDLTQAVLILENRRASVVSSTDRGGK